MVPLNTEQQTLLLHTLGHQLIKSAGDAVPTMSLVGRLYLSSSGWLLLSVPNALGRGAFEALDENGVELPTRDTNDPNAVFNAHISVMSAKEVERIGGGDKITERGKMFRYQIGPVKTVEPKTWDGVSKVWYMTILSPELKELRKSYGLTPLPGPSGDWDFHCTFAIRRTGVLGRNDKSKAAAAPQDDWDGERREDCAHCGASFERSEEGYCNSCGRHFDSGEVPAKGLYHEGSYPAGEEKEAKVHPFRPLNAEPEFIAANREWFDAERAAIAERRAKMAKTMMSAIVDAAAAECEEPKSEEQARAGNYRHGHCKVHGLPITLETARGMVRKGTDKDGKPWSIEMKHHYGYIKRTESEADGDHIDVFIGPNPESYMVFIVDQYIDGEFDEHKCLIGFKTKADAEAGYLACYDKDWKGLGSITAVALPAFKKWIAEGDSSKPYAERNKKASIIATSQVNQAQPINVNRSVFDLVSELKEARLSNTLLFGSTIVQPREEPVTVQEEPVDMLALLMETKRKSRQRQQRRRTPRRIKTAANSHVLQALKTQPFVWRGGLSQSLLNYIQGISERAQSEIHKSYNTDRMLQSANPDYKWQQARNAARGVDSVVTHPLDKTFQTVNMFAGSL